MDRRNVKWAWLVLANVVGAAVLLSGQAPAVRPANSELLDALLQGAATRGAGTYSLVNGSLVQSRDSLPVIVQADVLRGANQTIRVPIVLGAKLPWPAAVRLRILGSGTTANGGALVVSEASGTGGAGDLRLIHEFSLRPGDYEIHAGVVRAQSGVSDTIGALVKTRLTVPDIWGGTLALSPLVLGDATDAAPPAPGFRPFVFGPTALSPATSARFGQTGELRVAFRIYNWNGPAGTQPDMTVGYAFYQQGDKRTHFFNKMKPQRLNSDTLEDTFDPAARIVSAGAAIPLQSFPIGDFQLTVRVTDNRTKQTAVGQTMMSVSP